MTRTGGHRQEHPRTNSATSYPSARYGTEMAHSTSSSARTPIQMPMKPRNGSSSRYDREYNISPNTFPVGSQSSLPHSPPKPAAPITQFGDHRRELAVLQDPGGFVRHNSSSGGAGANGSSVSATTPSASFILNSNIFDTTHNGEQFQLNFAMQRPGTAPSTGSQTSPGQSDSYFPAAAEEQRRPSVASVVTNASSTGSKSSMGRSFYKKIFGEGENDSPGSSESSLPPNVTPRSHYGFPRPTTPTTSRPRTPVPSSDVVPFLYQDPNDIQLLGDAPVHENPVQAPDERNTNSSQSHRLLSRGRKERDKGLDKELPPRPSTGGKDPFLNSNDYKKGLRLHLDGTASNTSSQVRLGTRSGSPTPSIASGFSAAPPKSPGDHAKRGPRSIWNRITGGGGGGDGKEKAHDGEKESAPRRLRSKASVPLLGNSNHNGTAPINMSQSKRGSGGTDHLNRSFEYASTDQLIPKKSSSRGYDSRLKAPRRGISSDVIDGKKDNRKGRNAKTPVDQGNTFEINADFSDIGNYVKLPGPEHSTPPGPDKTFFLPHETPPMETDITWEPPESWNTHQVVKGEGDSDEEVDEEYVPDESQAAQYCIRVFRADSTFATLSCKLSASVNEVLTLLGRKSFLQDNLSNYQIVMRKNGQFKILGPNERPLRIQKRLLEQAGYDEGDHLDEIGRDDHSYLVRFTFMMARTGGYSLDPDPGLSKMQKFSHVDLQGRNLLTIPITLYHKAAEIISLNLSKNLSLNIPKDFIQQCVNLRKIEFNNNDAERLPSSIAAASRLTYLDISNNRLEDVDSAQLDAHTALVALKMSNNRLTSLPQSFRSFESLRTLHLSSNSLTEFPPFICELVTLTNLDVSFNMIPSLPLEIGQLSALETLTATNNRLSGSLPKTFSSLGFLKELDLRFNELTDIDVIAELPRLEAVVVSHNRLSRIEFSFGRLRALHLNSNPITRFNLPTPMPTLKHLNLSNAKIAAIAEPLFEKLPNLEKLLLDNNHIVSFPSQLCKLRRLEYLSCSKNELASLPKEIGQLQDLKHLDLHYNNLKILPGELWQMNNLVTLNVSSNILNQFPRPVMNPIVSTPPISECPSPPREKELSVEDPNKIDPRRRPSQQQASGASGPGLLTVGTSPTPDGRKSSIVSIYGTGGRKTSVISKSSFENGGGTQNSRKDSAASNKMSNTFAYTLRYLHLADNRLSDEVFEELSLLGELRVLNLSYNDLLDVPPGALSRMGQLQELYLSGNELTSLPSEDLEHIPHLKVLHINGNKFQTLPAELGKIRKLLVLDVGSNSLKYNISNWPYDWNWNWNLELKYLNMSGNKRLEIKPNRADNAAAREKSITDFSALSKLRVLGLMDVTLTIPNVPEQTEDRRVRLSGTTVRSMAYGMADSMGRYDHLSMIDMVLTPFRGVRDECVIGLFDGQSLSSGGSKVSKYIHESLEFFLKEELNKLRPTEPTSRALHRAFLNLNKELATTAMQTLDEKSASGPTRHPSTGSSGPLLSPDDLASGGAATVIYITASMLCVANVGDAMAIMTQSGGDYKILTKKHSPGDPSEIERIRDAGGYVSKTGKLNGVLDTSRAFGYFHLMPSVNAAPATHEVKISDQDELLVLASKECWEYISFQSAVDIVRTERNDLMKAAHKLRDFAISYGAIGKIMVMVLAIGDMKKAKNKFRTQSVSLGPGQSFPADDELPSVRATRRKLPKEMGPEDSGLRRLEAEVPAPEGELAMVFTDIKNSTLLWETYPTAMRSGIRVHNTIMRRQLRIVGGYEVKTEGDAFMVCFPTATSALRWCFSVQQLLLDAAWPNEILDSEQGQELHDTEGNLIYRGLSVRMGMHWGAPVCEPDPITKRMDYFGPIVNRAARISAEADGGQITVSSDFVAEINRCVKAYQASEANGAAPEDVFGDEAVAQAITRELRTLSSQGFEVKELGERKLKGLENPEFIYLMYPQSLVGRLSTNRGPVKNLEPPAQITSLVPDEVWALWDISNRLEMVCSALNTDGVPNLKPPSMDLISGFKLRLEGGASDQQLVPLFEHIVTRIENSLTTLYLRRLVVPGLVGSVVDTAGSLMDIIGALEARLGQNISRAVPYTPERRISDVTESSPEISPTTTVHTIRSDSTRHNRTASSSTRR